MEHPMRRMIFWPVNRWGKDVFKKTAPWAVSRDLEVVAAAALRVELDSELQLLYRSSKPGYRARALGQFLNLGL